MSTRPISFFVDGYYHIYSRGVEKRKIFLDSADYDRFVRLLFTSNSDTVVLFKLFQGKALEEIPRGRQIVSLGAWCLMPNHFHLLIKEKEEQGITRYLHRLLTGYAMYFNKRYDRSGALFQGKFGAKLLNRDQYLGHQYSYIHLNPLGIIDKDWKNRKLKNKKLAWNFLTNYKYSSCADYKGIRREENALLDKEAFPKYFERPVDFELMLKNWLNYCEGERTTSVN